VSDPDRSRVFDDTGPATGTIPAPPATRLLSEKTRDNPLKAKERHHDQGLPNSCLCDCGRSRAIGRREEKLTATTTAFETIEVNLTMALDLASNCHQAYLDANDHLRRLFNQASFVRLDIVKEGLQAELAPPFDVLLAPEVLQAGHDDASADQTDSGVTRPRGAANAHDLQEEPSRLMRTGGSSCRPLHYRSWW
jgi:hypothetical protein